MSSDIPEAIPAPPARKPWALLLVGLLGLTCAIAGGVLLLRAGAGTVTLIRVTKHSMIPEALVGSPDYYLIVQTNDKKTITTKVYDDTPIGNGLDFEIPKLDLKNVVSIELFDEDVGPDDIRDRVDVRERVCRGQDYQFELIGPASPEKGTGTWLLAGGGAAVGLAVILWVRSRAI